MALFGDYAAVFIMGLVGMVFAAPTLIIPRILAPKAPNPIKNAPFECGQVPRGRGKMHFMMQYYAYLLMFVVFDVMAMFLFAWAVAYQPLALGRLSSFMMFIFVTALLIPMALTVRMAGRKGDLVEAAQVPKTGDVNVLVGKATDFLEETIGPPLRYVANWGRLYSLWPVHLETACCVPPDTIVLGDNKQISDYSVNDKVTGVTGLVDVVRTFSRPYQGPMVKITGRGMFPLLATPEHPIMTVERTVSFGKGTYLSETKWKNAGDLMAAPPMKRNGTYLYPNVSHDCLLIPRSSGFVDSMTIPLGEYATPRGLSIVRGRGMDPPLEFPLTTETAWLLGVYVAEGWDTPGHDVFFSLSHDEVELRERIFRIARSLGHSPQIKRRDTATVVRFSSSIMARAMSDWCGHLAENKKIPDFILYHNDLALLRAFLSGYLEGDGAKVIDARGPEYARADTVSKTLALQLQLAFARFGEFAKIYRKADGGEHQLLGRTVATHDSYSISVLTSDRRCSDFHMTPEFIAVPIRKIERVDYTGAVNNLETGDNTYLVSNAVVHNCSVEVGATAGSRFDAERFGVLEAFGSLRQCDLIIVMGTVTRKLAPRLKLIYDQMAEPKWVIAMGACSITGGLYFDSYNVLRGIDDIIPVDVYVPGCPPRAESLMQGVALLQNKIRHSSSIRGR